MSARDVSARDVSVWDVSARVAVNRWAEAAPGCLKAALSGSPLSVASDLVTSGN